MGVPSAAWRIAWMPNVTSVSGLMGAFVTGWHPVRVRIIVVRRVRLMCIIEFEVLGCVCVWV